MALSRLHDLAMPYIYDYLDPTGELRKPPVEIDVETSDQSLGISRVYTKSKALSMFVRESQFGQLTFSGALRPDICFHDDFRFVHREDADHDDYHKSKDDFEIDHTHILKGKTKHQEMKEGDVKCIIDHIKQFESQIGICTDGENECVLATQDAEKITRRYNQYLRQKKRAANLDLAAEKLYSELQNKCIAGGKSFVTAFLSTFLDKYIVPCLINQGIHYKTAARCSEALKSAIVLGLSNSMMQTALDFIIRNAIEKLLTTLGMNPRYIEKITTEIGTVVAFTSNPFSLINLAINSTSAAAGQIAAYQLIHALPKLKSEPRENTSSLRFFSGSTATEAVAVEGAKQRSSEGSTLIQRKSMNNHK
jgi:hypothetical protein